jgi:hypothetical protein
MMKLESDELGVTFFTTGPPEPALIFATVVTRRIDAWRRLWILD